MLLWQLNERNKYIFLLQLVVVSTAMHMMLGLLLFVVYKGGTTSFRVELGKSHSPTLFMPLKRHAGGGHAGTGRTGKSSSARATIRRKGNGSSKAHVKRSAGPCAPHVQDGQQEYKQLAPVKEQAHRLGSSTTMGWDTAPSRAQRKKHASRVHKKEMNKKTKKKGSVKQEKKVKHEVPLSAEPEQKIEKKPVEHSNPVVPEAKAEVPAVVPEAKVDEQPIVATPEQQEALQCTESQSTEPGVIAEQEVEGDYGLGEITLGQENNGECITAEQARMYECIEQEIVSRWRPPRGLSKDLVCQIKCSIGGSGTVVACKLEQSSGVLIYDMAARSAARAMTLPRWSWAKEFTIIFKQ